VGGESGGAFFQVGATRAAPRRTHVAAGMSSSRAAKRSGITEKGQIRCGEEHVAMTEGTYKAADARRPTTTMEGYALCGASWKAPPGKVFVR